MLCVGSVYDMIVEGLPATRRAAGELENLTDMIVEGLPADTAGKLENLILTCWMSSQDGVSCT